MGVSPRCFLSQSAGTEGRGSTKFRKDALEVMAESQSPGPEGRGSTCSHVVSMEPPVRLNPQALKVVVQPPAFKCLECLRLSPSIGDVRSIVVRPGWSLAEIDLLAFYFRYVFNGLTALVAVREQRSR